jgi:hypothetical protein
MSRVPQSAGQRGSLKWIQRAVNEHRDVLDAPLLAALGARHIHWRSPLAYDDFAEYRDGDFLKRLGLERLTAALKAFWPDRGPQWDALALSDGGDVLLIEAKAHIDELCSPPSAASEASRARIDAALAQTAGALDAAPRTAWAETFYQLASRLAHLHFLRANGVPAWLVLVNFVGDADMGGPANAGEWEAAYRIVHHVMGLGARHKLARHVIHLYPDVRTLA